MKNLFWCCLIVGIFLNTQALAQLELDPTFNSTGIATFALGSGGAEDMAIQQDNKIIEVGNCVTINFERFPFCVGRLNENGTIDTTFNGGTFRIAIPGADISGSSGAGAGGIAIQADGKAVMAGHATFSGQKRVVLARLNTNGSLDTSFGTGGIVTTDIEPSIDDRAEDIDLQPDGKIIIAGYYGGSNFRQFVARYLANGALDTSFGNGGVVKFSSLGTSSRGGVLALQADGKIMLGGLLEDSVAPGFFYLLARLNSDGSPDTSWDGDGFRSILLGASVFSDDFGIISIAMQADGRAVALGSRDIIFRFNTNGSLDTGFDGDGSRPGWMVQNHVSKALAVAPDGKIIVTGNTTSSSASGSGYTSTLARFLPDGSPDGSFSEDGYFFLNRANSGGRAVAIDSQGRTVVGGLAGTGFTAFEIPIFFTFRLKALAPARPFFDYDGDRKADIAVYRASNNNWYIFKSSNTQLEFHNFGLGGDILTPADFDGDGKFDVSIFRPSTGFTWYREITTGNYNGTQFGASGDIPVHSDYTGDGKADYVVFRPSNGVWYRYDRSNNQTSIIQFGSNGDIPVIADFDGDGKSDLAVYCPSLGDWYWMNSSNGQFFGYHFGAPGDLTVPADYDGDGKTEFAVYRPSNGVWYRIMSGNGQFASTQFGISTDKPVPADYDGDGKTDIGVFRQGLWIILNSQSGSITGFQFGVPTDDPIPNAYVR